MNKTLPIKQTLYRQVADHVCREIANGTFRSGRALPAETELAESLQVSQGTVRRALDDLVQQGLLVRRQGVGTFVAAKNADWGSDLLCNMNALSSRLMVPQQEILSITAGNADEYVAQELNLHRAARVWQVVSLWRIGALPVASDEAFLPIERLPELNQLRPSRDFALADYLNTHYAVRLQEKRTVIGVARLNAAQAQRLQQTQAAGLLMRRLSVSADGVPLEFRQRVMPQHGFFLCAEK
ncbi:MAG: GntR family transcriptional regulator [Neisseria sp.]|nr:GntR family transcriptional regulator [Neisseria sp.]